MSTLAALPVLLALTGCNSAPSGPPLTVKAPQANVLLVCIDTLRADALGTYGQPLPTSPTIDAWAAKSVVFERAWTQYTWTLPSFVSYMTSTYARTHGWRAKMAKFDTYPKMDTDIPSLATTLKAAGYSTNAQMGNGHLIKDLAFDQGFDIWVNGQDKGVLAGSLAELKRWPADDKPRFLYTHFKGPHVGLVPTAEALAAIGSDLQATGKPGYGYEYYYAAKPEEKEARLATFRTAYHAVVWDTDVRMKALFEALEATGEANNTVVALMSDHGEMLGVTGQLGHNRSVREEVTRIPLIIQVPGQEPKRVGGSVARLIDLAPSIIEAVGLTPPPSWQGSSWYSNRPDSLTVSERDDLTVFTEQGDLRLVDEQSKSKVYAFDLKTDPDELTELDAAKAPALQSAKTAWESGTPVGTPGPLRDAMPEDERAAEAQRLKALGYVE